MPDISILSWNIRDLNEDQVKDPNFISLMVKVIQNQKVHLVSILETKSNQGKHLGPKLKAQLKGSWDFHASKRSARHSNKPENYVYLWDGKNVKSKDAFAFPVTSKYIPASLNVATPIGYPNRHDNPRKKSPSRFPYIGKFRASNTDFTCVAFHTTFASVDIAESNQNLAYIDDVNTDANVIVMGDLNDDPSNCRSYRKVPGFKPLRDAGLDPHITAKTSLCQAYDPSWKKPVDCRANVYDNFFVKNLTVKSAVVVDLVEALQHPNWLNVHGKAVFNSWATRQNAKKKSNIPLFKPGEEIKTLEDAHEVHWVAVSDHLPIQLTITVA